MRGKGKADEGSGRGGGWLGRKGEGRVVLAPRGIPQAVACSAGRGAGRGGRGMSGMGCGGTARQVK
jgi:hypothetical protein